MLHRISGMYFVELLVVAAAMRLSIIFVSTVYPKIGTA
jgi:hypothetical protein